MPGINTVDLAERLAADRRLTRPFRDACNRHDSVEAERLVQAALTELRKAASTGWTKQGRTIKLQQAQRVFKLLGEKAHRAPSVDTDAEAQAMWCSAILAALDGQLVAGPGWTDAPSPPSEELMIPRPIAPIVNRMNEFLDLYARYRTDCDDARALSNTLAWMLKDDEPAYGELLDYMNGKFDATPGYAPGAEFTPHLIESGERYVAEVSESASLPVEAKSVQPVTAAAQPSSSSVFDAFRLTAGRLSRTEVMDFISYGTFSLDDADGSVHGVINWLTEETKKIGSRRTAVADDDLYTAIANQIFTGYGVGRFVLGSHTKPLKYGKPETGSAYQSRLMELVLAIQNSQMEAVVTPSVGGAIAYYEPPPVISQATADREEAFKLATFAILEGLKIAIAEQEMLAGS